jgi:multicomponent Na+:H+ antiporter subunit G
MIPGLMWSLAIAAESEQELHVLSNPFVDALLLFGSIFVLAAGIGVFRFPDFYTRLHAATKLVTFGGLGIFAAAAIAFSPFPDSARVLLVAAFYFLTAPLSSYMIARSGYLRGLKPYQEEGSVDEWQALGTVDLQPAPESHHVVRE